MSAPARSVGGQRLAAAIARVWPAAVAVLFAADAWLVFSRLPGAGGTGGVGLFVWRAVPWLAASLGLTISPRVAGVTGLIAVLVHCVSFALLAHEPGAHFWIFRWIDITPGGELVILVLGYTAGAHFVYLRERAGREAS